MRENSQKIYGLRWTAVCAAAVFVFSVVAFIRASGYALGEHVLEWSRITILYYCI